jgi:cellulose biosynthesis protein BcsQ
MKTISFYNAKGGTGKTSLCYLLGLYLASKGNKILFLDLDSQKSLTSTLALETMKDKNIFDCLADYVNLNEIINKKDENISFVAGALKVLKLQSQVLQSKLSKEIKRVNNFDFVLIDCPPTFNNLIVSAIQASDILVIPSLISLYDLESVEFVVNEVSQIKKIDIHLILNRVNKSVNLESKYLALFKESFADLQISRFPNLSGVRKIIDNKDSLGKKSYDKIRENLEILERDIFRGNE